RGPRTNAGPEGGRGRLGVPVRDLARHRLRPGPVQRRRGVDDGSPSDKNPSDHFGTAGKVTTNFGCLISGACNVPSYDTAYSLVESTYSNSIYAVGKTNYTGYDRFAVASYLESDGSRDPNFHKTGLPSGLCTGPLGIAY